MPAARPFAAVYDDNPALAGMRLDGGGQTPIIVQPDAGSLRSIDAILICAYLHDTVIAGRLRALGFQGNILSARPPVFTRIEPPRLDPAIRS